MREIIGDVVRFVFGKGCGDVNWESMAGVSMSMVIGEGGASSSAVEA